MAILLASAIPKHVQEIGAIAGFASFVVFLALLGLYVARAIELHRLRKTMPFLANPQNGNGQPDTGNSRASASGPARDPGSSGAPGR